ncbi:hypothetical protein Dda_4345 [Drechslerella dactyloides]|uniref:Uncharacterized protein n=1 Tax=Drechslerella dactyloides TaxID=74499 RepID=A0AAD6NJ13_DREDA|nr:hypothetical protein Dda_4345 [Drechslerella dactyloides]
MADSHPQPIAGTSAAESSPILREVKAKRPWPPDFSKMSDSDKYRLERKYRRRLRRGHPAAWMKFTGILQILTVTGCGDYGYGLDSWAILIWAPLLTFLVTSIALGLFVFTAGTGLTVWYLLSSGVGAWRTFNSKIEGLQTALTGMSLAAAPAVVAPAAAALAPVAAQIAPAAAAAVLAADPATALPPVPAPLPVTNNILLAGPPAPRAIVGPAPPPAIAPADSSSDSSSSAPPPDSKPISKDTDNKPAGNNPAGDKSADGPAAGDKPAKSAGDKPADAKPTDGPAAGDKTAGPASDKPADAKPADSPAAGDKTAEPASNKPADAKPADGPAAGNKPAGPAGDGSADAKPADGPAASGSQNNNVMWKPLPEKITKETDANSFEALNTLAKITATEWNSTGQGSYVSDDESRTIATKDLNAFVLEKAKEKQQQQQQS